MPISITPIFPVNAAQGAAPELVLQPGTVVNAQVLQILADDLVRIAINSLSIDVLSAIPLQAGQALQLAVSQTTDGVRLAVVGQGAAAADAPSLDSITLAPAALADVLANTPANATPASNFLTPVEQMAISSAAQSAATQQGSLAPLFANLGVAASSSGLPPALQLAIAQVLAQRTPLDQNLTGGDVKTAFETSGLFLEASLASGSTLSAAGIPDLKAALIVLRQALQSSLGANVPQEAQHEMPPEAGNASSPMPTPRNGETTVTANAPPPFRGALPSAQSIASPSIVADAQLATISHQLLSDADAAIARQILLQVASLPGQGDATTGRVDPTSPRWNFEIPFVTPQGTAVTHFEISRDGGGSEVQVAKRVWRARFSLDVEPAGPVHALISLSGDRTSVRMWAERLATAAQLRAGAAQLSAALSKAELHPGDIVIRDGAPAQPAPVPAGHFLDRAS